MAVTVVRRDLPDRGTLPLPFRWHFQIVSFFGNQTYGNDSVEMTGFAVALE
jgi:hypothetical protein